MAKNEMNEAVQIRREIGPGAVLGGRYELLTQIARGGMGYVWAARAKGGRGFRRLVAVKTMAAVDHEETRMEAMLLQEAKFASLIQHPNVVAVEDFGEDDGVCYLVMELVRGETLLKLVKASGSTGGIPLKIVVNLIGQVCRGLQAAHDLPGEDGQPLGLIHRDVTPGNIIVSYGGMAKLSDFGIAKAAVGTALTQNGELKGKMSYMAPEQLLQKSVDRRVDVFSVGVTLYVATTGIHPFRNMAGGMGDVLSRILSSSPPPTPRSIIDSYPEGLEKVVMKAIAKKPEDRYATAKELLEALVQAMPEAFETGMEKEIQEYLGILLSDQVSETTANIRAAEGMAENHFSAIRMKTQGEETKKSSASRLKTSLILGTMFVCIAALVFLAVRPRKPEVVERTRTVYLPGEVRTVTITQPATPTTPTVPTTQKVQTARASSGTKRVGTKANRPDEEASGQAESTEVSEENTQPLELRQEDVEASFATAQKQETPKPMAMPTSVAQAGPRLLSSSEGQKRLAIDPSNSQYRPYIPRILAEIGPFTADVRTCVGPNGIPESVSVKSANPAMSPSFQKALSRWRYKPLMDGTKPVSFCYSFRYEIQ